jgi:hypothetical protein
MQASPDLCRSSRNPLDVTRHPALELAFVSICSEEVDVGERSTTTKSSSQPAWPRRALLPTDSMKTCPRLTNGSPTDAGFYILVLLADANIHESHPGPSRLAFSLIIETTKHSELSRWL